MTIPVMLVRWVLQLVVLLMMVLVLMMLLLVMLVRILLLVLLMLLMRLNMGLVPAVRMETAVMGGRRLGCLMRMAATLRGLLGGGGGPIGVGIALLAIALRMLAAGMP